MIQKAQKLSLFVASLSLVATLSAQQLTPSERLSLDKVKPGPTIHFSPTDSEALRLAKAATVVPSASQLAWQELEFTCFIHFGINTFTGREWGNGMEDPNLFNPSKVDADQWCRTAKAAGMKMMMITVKHHDGFCTWQTRYNDDFSMRSTAWENGKGDVLRKLADACKKHDLKLGVYLSPADLYQIENKKGLYGNGSKYQESTIPTDPKSFKSRPLKGRKAPAGKPTFKYKVDDYNRYMLNQLYEVLTEYGPIDEVWFDGAHPKRKGGQTYTEKLWFDMIYKLCPNVVIFGGTDVRWCGNEHGGTRKAEWSPTPVIGQFDNRQSWKLVNSSYEHDDIASRSKLGGADFMQWWPSEVDTSIRHGWFWRDENQHVRSADEVFDIYERSIGGNSVLLLNVPPNRDGVFAPRDVEVLKTVGKRIKATYGKTAANITAKGKGIYNFDKPALVNRILLQEQIETHGQRVEKFAVDAWIDGSWKEVTTGQTIGYKTILRTHDVTTTKLRVRILAQRLNAKISNVSVHYDLAPLKTPEIARSKKGQVTIKGTGSIHYTTDGSTPTKDSPVYTSPFTLLKGGFVKAIALRGEKKSEVSSVRFFFSKEKWSIHHVSSEEIPWDKPAKNAIDDDHTSHWHSRFSTGETDPMPHSLTINFGEGLDVKGFGYRPRTMMVGGGGIVDQYKVELSRDGKKWVTASKDRFDNIKNDPSLREVFFKKEYKKVRYLRFTSLHSIDNKPHSSAGEIEVIAK